MKLLEELSRSGSIGFGRIVEMANAMKIPDYVREKALELFSEAKEKYLLCGRSTEIIASACLYIACRIHKEPWTIENIVKESNSSIKNTRKASEVLLQKLEIKLSPADPSVFINKFCADLKLSGKVKLKAEKILETAKEAAEPKLTDGKAGAIAAAIVYIAALLSGEHCTQKEVSDATDVTVVTISKRYQEIARKLDIDTIL